MKTGATSPNIAGLIPEPGSQTAGFVSFYLEHEHGDFDSMWPEKAEIWEI